MLEGQRMYAVAPKEYTMNNRQKFHLSLTEEQAVVLQEALNVYFRLGMGQTHDMWSILSFVARGEDKEFNWTEWHDAVDQVNNRMSVFFPFNLNNGSYGIGNPKVKEKYKIAVDIHDVIRHGVSWDRAIREGLVNDDGSRNWSNMMGVNYDKPFKHSMHPLPNFRIDGDCDE